MAEKRRYDSTVARIAGNIVPGILNTCKPDTTMPQVVSLAVIMARAIVAEVERTEPVAAPPPPQEPR